MFNETLDFMPDGGEMGHLTREHDWLSTGLGSPDTWPQGLRTALRLVLTTQHPMFIWWGQDLIQFYNDAYRRTMGPERHPGALGQSGRACWAEIWPAIGPQIEHVMAGRGATWHEDQLVPVMRNGRREDVWWTYGYSPIDDDDGVGGVLVICSDVTRQHVVVEELRIANDELAHREMRLRSLFTQAPGFMCVLRGPDHVYELANDAYRQLIGDREGLLGRTLREVVPEARGQGFFELLDQVYASGVAHVGRNMRLRLDPSSEGPARELRVDFVYQPILGADGNVSGIFVEGSDVTEATLAQERQALLIRELHHRVGNTLAIIQAVMRSTARLSNTTAEFTHKFSGRLSALARTQALLIEAASQTVGFRDLLTSELAVYMGERDQRIVLDGPDIELSSHVATPLAMAVHELTANAEAHGALAGPEGKVRVLWLVKKSAEGWDLHWEWTECEGPAVVQPTRLGFGSWFLREALTVQTKAEVQMQFNPSGLRAKVMMPFATDQNGLAGAEARCA
jgi:two-component sensor histidine kinase/PAS domain-containing protein